MRVTAVRDALLTVLPNDTYHYKADPKKSARYVVWGETGQDTGLSADDCPQDVVIRGEVWYYTKTEYDATVNRICAAMSAAGISWTLTEIGYDDELSQIVYGFAWEVVCGAFEIY